MTTDQTKEGTPSGRNLTLAWHSPTPQNRDYSPYRRLERQILAGGTDTGNYALNTLFKISIDILGSPVKGDQWRTSQILGSWERLLRDSHGTPFEEDIFYNSQILFIWGCTYGREPLCTMHLGTQPQQERYHAARDQKHQERITFGSHRIGRIFQVADEKIFHVPTLSYGSN